MKKIISLIMAVTILLTVTTACSQKQTDTNSNNDQKELKIVTTIFPLYDWTNSILGENSSNTELSLLIDSGVDLHSFQPTADDIISISDCDLFVYVGGESDSWVTDVLANKTNKDMKVLNLMELLGDSVKVEELIEGMQESEHHHDHAEDEHDHDHEEDEHDHDHEEDEHDHDHEEDEHDHEHEEEHDEHVWLSLKNAEVISQSIANALIELDSENKDNYNQNVTNYISKLDSLDVQYKEAVQNANKNTLLFGDRFPFRYLVDDYNINYYAAFVGCSAETEASFETIIFLANKVDELGLEVVLEIDSSEHEIAQTIVDNTKSKDQKVLSINSMQSVTDSDIQNGANYISIMENNLEVIKEALS